MGLDGVGCFSKWHLPCDFADCHPGGGRGRQGQGHAGGVMPFLEVLECMVFWGFMSSHLSSGYVGTTSENEPPSLG